MFPTELLTAIWGTGPDDVWVVGERISYHYDGHAWTKLLVGGTAVWGAGRDDVWIVGNGFAIHWDGKVWRRKLVAPGLRAIAGTARDDVWAASGENVYHFDGESWSPTPPPVSTRVGSLVAPARGKVWLLGAEGLLACAQAPPPPKPQPPPINRASVTDMAGPFASIEEACQKLGVKCDEVPACYDMTYDVYTSAGVRTLTDGPDGRVYLLVQLFGAWYASAPISFASKTEFTGATVKSGSTPDRILLEVDLSTRTDSAPDEPTASQQSVLCGLGSNGAPRCAPLSTGDDIPAVIDFQ